jgi:hypothetical protein
MEEMTLPNPPEEPALSVSSEENSEKISTEE